MIYSPRFLIKIKKINSIVAFYCNQIYINVKFKGFNVQTVIYKICFLFDSQNRGLGLCEKNTSFILLNRPIFKTQYK